MRSSELRAINFEVTIWNDNVTADNNISSVYKADASPKPAAPSILAIRML